MDKPLSNNNNPEKRREDDQSPAGGGALASPSNLSNGQIGAYSSTNQLSQQGWDKSHKAWSDSTRGRIAIRSFSRGIMGAAFFTAGGMLTRKWMHSDSGLRYHSENEFLQQENPLQFIAKLIDMTAGNAIKVTVREVSHLGGKSTEQAAYLGERAVHFRGSKYSGGKGAKVRGRSLGDEVVAVTFDFFCASVGDAWGRDIAGWFDPNAKKSWMKDGKVSVPEAVKAAATSVARYVTYNGGEDWAVAIPYVYFMAASRHGINKISPGFIYDPSRNTSGGSHKVDERGRVVGNYNLEGIVDLQGRFTVYNMGTLMYREAYNFALDRLKGRDASLYGARDKKEKPGVIGGAVNLVKWTLRSIVKGGIYMTPAVPFFWITRTPQSKRKALFIHPQKGMIGYQDVHKPGETRDADMVGKPKYETLTSDTLKKGIPDVNEFYFTRYVGPHAENHRGPGEKVSGEFLQSKRGPAANFESVMKGKNFKNYDNTFNIADAGLNAIGRANYKAGKTAGDMVKDWEKNPTFTRRTQGIREALGLDYQKADGTPHRGSLKGVAATFVDASASYTPYMIAKAEFANLWDSGKTDLAAERMIDGAFKFNWGEFKAGARELGQAVLWKPFDDPAREAEAQRRISIDETRADAAFRNSADIGDNTGEPVAAKPANWQKRIIQGKKPEEKKAEKTEKPSASHAEKEAMRKALSDLTPPTNSIH